MQNHLSQKKVYCQKSVYLSQNSVKPNEVDYFLADNEVSMEMINRYPQIKNLFIKHNKSIPTSAPVERLFSQAALVLTVRRNKLSDSFLEILILLKIALHV